MSTVRRPWWAAVRAAVIPAAPLPTTITSYSSMGPILEQVIVFAMPLAWDSEADVVVVGFGGAGACAAIEAARAGASVVALDRFNGGGATAMSGGVVYAGGGTSVQRAAEVTDTVDDMVAYLREEVGNVVSPTLLAEFCASSASMIDWLASVGVPFDPSVCPYK